MITITKYNEKSGQILGVIAMNNPKDATLQCGEGEGWIKGTSNPATQMVVRGKLVARPADVLEAEEINHATLALRANRDHLLAASDWTQLADVSLTPTEVLEWRDYRQKLRELMTDVADPRNVQLPKNPKGK